MTIICLVHYYFVFIGSLYKRVFWIKKKKKNFLNLMIIKLIAIICCFLQYKHKFQITNLG